MNFACYWTFGVQWMAVFMPPMILVSLLSVCFALRFLTSKFAPAEQ
ncbi:MAG: hypothetical protein ICV73_18340 [Acetobacteraceae bacterium]|nr:hypothetical protein [Acetobacteraceae bacterium]